jgi:CopG family nickel-responsive transcriptional regulator
MDLSATICQFRNTEGAVMEKLTRFGVSLPEELLKKFDPVIRKKGYASRSEALRDLIRDKLVEEYSHSLIGEMVGTLTLIYDHHSSDLQEKLTDLQHHNYRNIISTTHVHLDEHNCLEVLILKGKNKKVKEIADHLTATKGVKHGKLVMTTTGKDLK